MSTGELINTGILMGIIHVITGPDHLSALATLCGTNIQRAGRREATRVNFCLGVRWGLGHSVGLLFVGGILIAVEEGSDKEWIVINPVMSMILQGFVGLFMLALGTYGIVRANRNKRERVWPMNDLSLSLHSGGGDKSHNNSDYDMEDFDGILGSHSVCDDLSHCLSNDTPRMVETEDPKRTNSFVTVTLQQQRRNSHKSSSQQQLTPPDMIPVVTVPTRQSLSPSPQQIQRHTPMNKPQSNLLSATSLMTKHTQNHSIFTDGRDDFFEWIIFLRCGNMCFRFFQCNSGHLAIVTGIVHGVAGPGGVLGVIPAVQMHDAWLAYVYLVTFCLTSTFVMGGFAAFYGSLSQWLAGGDDKIGGDRIFMVEIGSALLSIFVGFVWLTLLSLGKMRVFA
ncbi:hypothetical protein ACHAXA_002665 [Cyclostephanos tholiformis]|uniref:Nickel/cobalt efflux system n=1 Tax=Cyclostephanos tholiformis TaxID=382380 RepID=A0ABD3R1H1_9STRA